MTHSAVATPKKKDKNFFEAMFDFKFDYFVTAKVMRVIYGLMLVGCVLGFFGAEIVALSELGSDYNQDEAIMLMFAAPIFTPIAMLASRVYCEMLIVFVRMAEHLREIAQRPQI